MNTTHTSNTTNPQNPTNSEISHPISKLICILSESLDKGDGTEAVDISFDELKGELQRTNDDQPVYNVNIKENDDVALIYNNDVSHDNNINNEEQLVDNFEFNCRSVVVDKANLGIIASQFNKILYNQDAIQFLQDKDWSKVVVQKCYEGTMITLFYHKDRWYITRRRCLDANESSWIKEKSYLEMFNESIEGKMSLDDLDKDNVYYFVLIHHKNKNIVNYNYLGKYYNEVYHIITTGQMSGNLEEGLVNIADMYDGEVELATKTLTSLLEPVILLFMGAVVAFIVLAVLLPIVDINEVL